MINAKGKDAIKVSRGGQPIAKGEALSHRVAVEVNTSKISQRILYSNSPVKKPMLPAITKPGNKPKPKIVANHFLSMANACKGLEKAKVKMGTKIPLNISFDKGWKLNEYGPSFLNLLEIVGEKSANLVATYDWNMIKNNVAFLPKLKKGKKYIIQGTIYYCQDKRNALCYISSYEQELSPSKDGKKVLNIEI